MLKLKPGLSSRGIVEGLNNFMFTGTSLESYNERISVSFPFQSDFKCSVNSDEIYQVVSKLTSEEGELQFVKNQLLLTTKDTKLGVSANIDEAALELLQTINIDGIDSWALCPKDLTKGLSLCNFSASRDMTQRYLSTICIKNNHVISSDDLRISMYTMESSIGTQILLPILSSTELESFKPTEFAFKNRRVYFKTEEGGIFSTLTIPEEYPDVTAFFEGKGEIINLPKQLVETLSAVTILAEGLFDIDKKIELVFKKGKLICKSSKETGWIETELPLEYKGGEVSVLINPIFLKQILEKTTEMIMLEGKAIFISGNFSHVMALCI